MLKPPCFSPQIHLTFLFQRQPHQASGEYSSITLLYSYHKYVVKEIHCYVLHTPSFTKYYHIVHIFQLFFLFSILCFWNLFMLTHIDGVPILKVNCKKKKVDCAQLCESITTYISPYSWTFRLFTILLMKVRLEPLHRWSPYVSLLSLEGKWKL